MWTTNLCTSEIFVKLRLGGNHRNDALVVAGLAEIHRAIDERKQRVVFADADVQTRIVLRAALANDDVAGDALLATENLDAKSLSC